MSGGVDSSVAAALLQEQGFEVSGMFMKNWSPEDIQSLSDCPWEQDQADAAAVCEKLGIPFRSINFEKEYRERVVNYFLEEYAAGRTPNPDVMCNKEIKFDAFLQAAQEMGAEYIATGHYAQISSDRGVFQLLRGVDPKKDQSYFLWTLSSDQLSKALFPLGGMTKEQVRELALKFDLPIATKKDSQGICFIGHLDLKQFLLEHLTAKPGKAYLLPPYKEGVSFEERRRQGALVGLHQGSMFYTIGERAGQILDNRLYHQIKGIRDVPSTYILEKDFEENKLYVTDRRGDEHFYVTTIYLEGHSIMLSDMAATTSSLKVQVRYQQKELAPISTITQEGELLKVTTSQPLWAVAPGQSLVFYQNERVAGGGIIHSLEHN